MTIIGSSAATTSHPGKWATTRARPADGVPGLNGASSIIAAMTRAMADVPPISIVLIPSPGPLTADPTTFDMTVLSDQERLVVAGPGVVTSRSAERERSVQRTAHITARTDDAAYGIARQLGVLLGHEGWMRADDSGRARLAGPPWRDARSAGDVHSLIDRLIDEPYEAGVDSRAAASGAVAALGRFGGRTMGVLTARHGCPRRLDGGAAEMAASFVRICDSFGIPLVVVADRGDRNRVNDQGEAARVFAASSAPHVTLLTRKSYRGAYVGTPSRAPWGTRAFTWPGGCTRRSNGTGYRELGR